MSTRALLFLITAALVSGGVGFGTGGRVGLAATGLGLVGLSIAFVIYIRQRKIHDAWHPGP